jgi:hypothetical protein
MNLLDSLKQNIAGRLAAEKSYNLPSLCAALGLACGEESEAFASKNKYVMRRLQALNKSETLALAKEVLERFSSYSLEETLDLLVPLDGVIPAITRRDLSTSSAKPSVRNATPPWWLKTGTSVS